jgi:hypothetical protein
MAYISTLPSLLLWKAIREPLAPSSPRNPEGDAREAGSVES